MVINRAIFVCVHLVNDLIDLLVTDEVASALNHAFDLLHRDSTILVDVQAIECLVGVESGSALQPLPQGLVLDLYLEVGAPHRPELALGVGQEAVVTPEVRLGTDVGCSAVQHC